ncbi:MAG: hypothetical protein QOI31_1769 [Solirubrobacterales bacterium]|jgi:hypothetical protein|nr:hypothetical protein [Solirubrobacterales bacterium]
MIGVPPARAAIADVPAWLRHAGPEGGEARFVEGYSAKEQALACDAVKSFRIEALLEGIVQAVDKVGDHLLQRATGDHIV